MAEIFLTIFTSGGFEPHGVHFAESPALMWSFIIINAIIAIAYLILPAELSYVYFKRRDFAFSWVFIIIAFFGVWCSMTHVMNIVVFWFPLYWFEGIISVTTGAVSLGSGFAYAIAAPLMLKLVGPAKLRDINNNLVSEIKKREETVEKLARIYDDFEKANRELIGKKEELERLNREMIERELKIIDMKKELDILRGNQG